MRLPRGVDRRPPRPALRADLSPKGGEVRFCPNPLDPLAFSPLACYGFALESGVLHLKEIKGLAAPFGEAAGGLTVITVQSTLSGAHGRQI